MQRYKNLIFNERAIKSDKKNLIQKMQSSL